MTAAEPIEPDSTVGPLDGRRCTAKKRDGSGDACGKYAILGGNVCASHGGSSPQVRRKAAEALLMQRALKLVPDPDDRPRLTDPIEKLRELCEEAEAVKDMLAVTVNELDEIGYRGGLQWEDGRLIGTGTEQTRAEWSAYEKALERQQKFLLDIAKLDLDKRWLEIQDWHRTQISGGSLLVLTAVLAALGLSIDDQQVRGLVVEQLKALPPVIDT